jgi:hypothetical protein
MSLLIVLYANIAVSMTVPSACEFLVGQTWTAEFVGWNYDIYVTFFGQVWDHLNNVNMGTFQYETSSTGVFYFASGDTTYCPGGVQRYGYVNLICYDGDAYAQTNPNGALDCSYQIYFYNKSLCNGCGSGSPTSTVSSSPSYSSSSVPSTASSSLSGGAVAGIIIGGVGLLGICLVNVYIYLRCFRNRVSVNDPFSSPNTRAEMVSTRGQEGRTNYQYVATEQDLKCADLPYAVAVTSDSGTIAAVTAEAIPL